MYKVIVLIIGFLLIGCSTSTQTPQPVVKARSLSYDNTTQEEDTYIMFALRAEQVRNNSVAGKIFQKLYQQTNNIEYLERGIKNYLVASEYQQALEWIAQQDSDVQNKDAILGYKAIALYGEKKYKDAQKIAQKLFDKQQSEKNRLLLADILRAQGKNQEALRLLQDGYKKNYSDKLALSIAAILQMQPHKAQEFLQTHIEVHGCSKKVCEALKKLYIHDEDYDALLALYERYYETYKDKKIVQKIIQLYDYKKDYVGLLNFLESSHADDATLLELYLRAQNYHKGYILAQKLYEQTGDISYLGQSAMFEYETYKDHLTRKRLNSIVATLSTVVKQSDDSIFLNYLGYLLIDHELDIPQGIEYVKKALKIKGDTAYYLDSLAWGYYKLGRCKEAFVEIQKARKLEKGDDEEVVQHYNEIQKCLQNPHYKKVILKR